MIMVRKENKVKRAFFHHNDFQRKMQNYVLYFFLDILMKRARIFIFKMNLKIAAKCHNYVN